MALAPGGRIVALTAAVVALCACSSSPTAVDGPDLVPDRVLARLDTYCGGPEKPDLGGGTLCVDNGFTLNDDDFSFANWGRSTSAEGNVTVQTLVDLFGRDAVCASIEGDGCVPRPGAVQLAEQWNNALSGGRCEGLAAMAVRFHLGLDDPAGVDSSVDSVADLSRDDPAVEAASVYWWATQFVPEVSERAAASRARVPLELVEQLVEMLAHDDGPTLGLYEGASGHSVVPFAVTRRGNDFVVHVYDNNDPGERREVLVDRRTGLWRYPRATTSADGSWTDWSGGAGTFELVPMSARLGPFTCPGCDEKGLASTGEVVVSLSSRDAGAPGRIRVSTGSGTVESKGDTVVSDIDGAVVRPGKGGASNVEVVVPATVGEMSVSVLPDLSGGVAGDVVVSVRRSGAPSILVSGDLAREDGDPVVVLDASSTTVTAPRDAVARVSIADGSLLARAELAAGGSLRITGGAGEPVGLVASDPRGDETGEATVPAVVDGASILVVIGIEDDGIVLSSGPLEPVTVVVTDDGGGPTLPVTDEPTIEVTAPD